MAAQFDLKKLATASYESEYHAFCKANPTGAYPLKGKYRTPKNVTRGGNGSNRSGTAKKKFGKPQAHRHVNKVATMGPRPDGTWSGKRRFKVVD